MATIKAVDALSGAAIIDEFKRCGVEFIVSVPDRVTSESVLRRVAADTALKLVRVCKEDEGVSICAALSVCGKRAVLLMQCTGLLDSVNALRAIAVEYEQPVVMMVGLLGHESESPPAESPKYGISVVPRILDAMNIAYEVLHSAGDEKRIAPAIERAYANSTPLAILIGRSPV
jgi:sulfopyruvate decarboxylase subunit alpha